MTRHELVDAFVAGEIGRRDFIRGLTALGISAGAALAYAQALAPDAAAGPQAGPFVTRFQAQETDYGTACTPGSPAANATALLAAELQLGSVVEGILGSFDQSDIPRINALETFNDHVNQHVDALNTVVTDLGGTPPSAPPTPTYTDPDDALNALLDSLSSITSLITGVVPVTENGEQRQAEMGIALNLGKHAGFVAALLNQPPTTSAFEQATCPT